jgi:hypothetical protein
MSTPATPVTTTPAPKPATPAATPAPTLTVAQEIAAIEKKIGVWLNPLHIVLVLALATSIFTGVYMFESKKVELAEAKNQAITQQYQKAVADAKQQDLNNVALQAQKDAVILQLNQANAQLTEANAQLASAAKAEAAALVQVQATVKAMTPTQQSQEWTKLVPSAVVTPNTNGFQINPQGGVDTILALEDGVSTHKQLGICQASLDNTSKQVQNDASILQAEKDKHASDLTTAAADLDASKKQTEKVQSDFNTYKKKAHRMVLRAYVAGVVTGVAITRLLGF